MPQGAEDGNISVHELFLWAAVWHFLLMISSLISPHPSLNRSSTYLRYSEFSHSQKRLSASCENTEVIFDWWSAVLCHSNDGNFGFPQNMSWGTLGTVRPFPNFHPERDALELQSALEKKGWAFRSAFTSSVNHSCRANFNFYRRRHGACGQDPGQSQQRSETRDRQDFWRNCTKGDTFSSVQRHLYRRIVRQDPFVVLCSVASCVCSPICLLIKHDAVLLAKRRMATPLFGEGAEAVMKTISLCNTFISVAFSSAGTRLPFYLCVYFTACSLLLLQERSLGSRGAHTLPSRAIIQPGLLSYQAENRKCDPRWMWVFFLPGWREVPAQGLSGNTPILHNELSL